MTSRNAVVLCLAVGLFLACASSSARADSVLFANSEARAAELVPELALALQGHGMLLLVRGIGDARSPLERAAAAQRIARNVGAGAALWVEHEPPLRLRAVGASGERMVEAPLPAPIEAVEPRVFASVAASLLLEARAGSVEPAPPPVLDTITSVPAGPVLPPLPVRPPPAREVDVPRRFFLRAGVTAALVRVRRHARSDRLPTVDLVNAVAGASTVNGEIDAVAAKRELLARGYDCTTTSSNRSLAITDCGVAVNPSGVVANLALDFAAGARVSDRVALSLWARVTPTAGRGTLSHGLLGLQLEVALLEPHRKGFWLNALGGLGVGRIQARPASANDTDAPYATSGLFNAHLGVQGGYRFSPNIGLYLGPTLHVGFPDRLFAIDPTLGVEARL